MIDMMASIVATAIMAAPVVVIVLIVKHFLDKREKKRPHYKVTPPKPKAEPQAIPQPVPKEPEPADEPEDVEARQYVYHLHGINHKNEDGKSIQSVIREIVDEYGGRDYFLEAKVKDFDEMLETEVDEVEDFELEGELKETEFNGDPAVKVYVDGRHVGWIAAEKAADVADMMHKYDLDVTVQFDGGKKKVFEYGEMTREDGVIFGDVIINYSIKKV